MPLIFVLGGARSGKSRFAQMAAEAAHISPILIATGQAFDDEMRERIARHQAERSPHWRTLEAPTDAAGVVADLGPGAVAVLDCLTLWLSNLMLADADLASERTRLLTALAASPARLWVVSNEVGLGLVPDTPLGRRFRDEAGRLNQEVAAIADEAYFLAAGLPLKLK